MIPPADDPLDLGIPPNRGPLPVGETLTLNLTLAFVPAIDAMPGRRGFGGSELTELSNNPPDLGIPPNRGPLPVKRNPNSKPNPRVRSGHQRNARPCSDDHACVFISRMPISE
ncbi:hypothetical protein CK203_066429 [Vitis vinifera]|uniref:Uncharacterized protein n=1 Tax=Vitis vinifera TaxID=29760 RepID=A0A438G2V8_VITVI|nr:hypothetical protein CK203_066429 [Vitis vinifera]